MSERAEHLLRLAEWAAAEQVRSFHVDHGLELHRGGPWTAWLCRSDDAAGVDRLVSAETLDDLLAEMVAAVDEMERAAAAAAEGDVEWVLCPDCGLSNHPGHWACVRCGAGLPDEALDDALAEESS